MLENATSFNYTQTMNLKQLFVAFTFLFAPYGVAKNGYMLACIDEYPPYQYLGSTPHGVHITALKKLAQIFNKQIQFIESPNFARCVRMLKNGEVDVIAGLNKSKEREEFAYFAPYRVEEDHVVISNKASEIIDYKSLQGKVIGVSRGTTYFRKFNDDNTLNKVAINSITVGIELILKKRIDVIITSSMAANLLIDDINKAHLKATVINRNDNKVSYFGFSKLNKLNLLPCEIIERTTQAFENGSFNDEENTLEPL